MKAHDFIPPDKGCKQAKAAGYSGPCLECPFEKCFEDGNITYPAELRHQQRNEEIRRDCQAGMTIKEISKKYGRSKRTIYRVLND